MLALHLLQSALVLINTIFLQRVLAPSRPHPVVLGPRQPLRLVLPTNGPPSRPRPPRGAKMTVPAQAKRTPAPLKAQQLAKYLRGERPDYIYLKEVFRHLRTELDVEVQREAKRLPYVPTEDDVRRYYQTVWKERRGSDVVLIKTLLYTGVRVAELVAIRLDDVDLDACRIRITRGKGNKDRVVPFPSSFKETLGLHMDAMRHRGAVHLFESSWKKPYPGSTA